MSKAGIVEPAAKIAKVDQGTEATMTTMNGAAGDGAAEAKDLVPTADLKKLENFVFKEVLGSLPEKKVTLNSRAHNSKACMQYVCSPFLSTVTTRSRTSRRSSSSTKVGFCSFSIDQNIKQRRLFFSRVQRRQRCASKLHRRAAPDSHQQQRYLRQLQR